MVFLITMSHFNNTVYDLDCFLPVSLNYCLLFVSTPNSNMVMVGVVIRMIITIYSIKGVLNSWSSIFLYSLSFCDQQPVDWFTDKFSNISICLETTSLTFSHFPSWLFEGKLPLYSIKKLLIYESFISTTHDRINLQDGRLG